LGGVQHSPPHSILMWLMSLIHVWTYYKIGKLNMWTLLCVLIFWRTKFERKSCLNWVVDIHILNYFFLPKPGFWNLFEFSMIKIT
jgi:hypothetical protein